MTHAHHDNHHRLITERRAAWLATPRRKRLRRREAGKRYMWTLLGHLRCCHGWRTDSATLSVSEVESVHEAMTD